MFNHLYKPFNELIELYLTLQLNKRLGGDSQDDEHQAQENAIPVAVPLPPGGAEPQIEMLKKTLLESNRTAVHYRQQCDALSRQLAIAQQEVAAKSKNVGFFFFLV